MIKRCSFTIASIEAHIRHSNGVVIINDLQWKEDRENKKIYAGHYYLVIAVSDTGKTFTTINLFSGKAVWTVRRQELKSRIRFPKGKVDGNIYPAAWFLTIDQN